MKKKILFLIVSVFCWWQIIGQLQNDFYTINVNTTTTFNVLSNDNIYPFYAGCGIDSALSNLLVKDYPNPFGPNSSQNGGVLIFNYPANTITYQPPSGYIGTDVFYYAIDNDTTPGACDTALVTVTIQGGSNPCANYSLTNISSSGPAGSVVLTATTLGYSSGQISWYNGGSYLGSGNPLTANLLAGNHTICAYANAVVYDSVLNRWDSCYAQLCDSVYVQGGGTPNICDSNSSVWFYDTITGSSNVGTTVYFSAMYSGFHGQTPYGYYTLNGNYLVGGLNAYATLPVGTHTVCLYAWYPVYDSITNTHDSCFVSTCSTFNVQGSGGNPCANYSLTNISSSGPAGSVVLTATTSGYSPGQISWYNGGSYLGSGNPLTANLLAGNHTVCAYANAVVYDSVLNRWDSCYAQLCDSVYVQGGGTPNICDSNSSVWFYDTITGSTNVGTTVYFYAMYSGFHGQTPYGYYTLNGNYLVGGLNAYATLPVGTHTVCLYAWYPVYDSMTNTHDSCFVSTCSTFNVQGSGGNPCANYSLTNISSSGPAGSVILTATTSGYSSGQISWYNGGSYLGSGNPLTANLLAGNHTVCAYANAVVYDSVLNRWDSCYAQLCDSIIVQGSGGNPCANYSLTNISSSGPAGSVILTATTSGYSSGQISWYNGGSYLGSGNPLTANLLAGNHTICAYANAVVYDSVLNRWDSCYAQLCDSVYVQGSSNPCANNSLSFNYTISGSNVTFTAAHPGYSPSDVSWFNGTFSLGTGTSVTTSLGVGNYMICAYASTVVYDSLTNTWDTCSNQYCDSVVVGTASIDELNQLTKFKLYPNPSNDIINVVLESESSIEATIIIRDLLGKAIQTRNISVDANLSDKSIFDVSSLKNGSYLITIVDNDNNQMLRTMRFVKK